LHVVGILFPHTHKVIHFRWNLCW